MALSKLCTTLRSKDTNLKTQLRFAKKDIEVLTKSKGSKDPYKPVPLDSITYLRNIPPFDHSSKWVRDDRQTLKMESFSLP